MLRMSGTPQRSLRGWGVDERSSRDGVRSWKAENLEKRGCRKKVKEKSAPRAPGFFRQSESRVAHSTPHIKTPSLLNASQVRMGISEKTSRLSGSETPAFLSAVTNASRIDQGYWDGPIIRRSKTLAKSRTLGIPGTVASNGTL
jgi:hypothetical protein